jgi:5-methylcytosine-specific restriction endonuclease McrA
MKMDVKICSKCGVEFPETAQYFYIKGKGKVGFRCICKKCTSEQELSHKDQKAEYDKIYRQNNLERERENDKKYYQNNKEKYKDYKRQHYEMNKETIIENQKQYYIQNKQYIFEYQKKYRKLNVVKISEQGKKYKKCHIEESNIRRQIYISKKLSLPHTLTKELWKRIKQEFNYRCAYCGKLKPLTQDHFIPLSKGGEYTINNIIPVCKSCNSSKNSGDFFIWYRNREFYSKCKEYKILKFLHYSGNVQQLSF